MSHHFCLDCGTSRPYPRGDEGIEAVSRQLDGLLSATKEPFEPGSLPCRAICLVIPAGARTSTFIVGMTGRVAESVKAITHSDSGEEPAWYLEPRL